MFSPLRVFSLSPITYAYSLHQSFLSLYDPFISIYYLYIENSFDAFIHYSLAKIIYAIELSGKAEMIEEEIYALMIPSLLSLAKIIYAIELSGLETSVQDGPLSN